MERRCNPAVNRCRRAAAGQVDAMRRRAPAEKLLARAAEDETKEPIPR
jgi:hypothetical protein